MMIYRYLLFRLLFRRLFLLLFRRLFLLLFLLLLYLIFEKILIFPLHSLHRLFITIQNLIRRFLIIRDEIVPKWIVVYLLLFFFIYVFCVFLFSFIPFIARFMVFVLLVLILFISWPILFIVKFSHLFHLILKCLISLMRIIQSILYFIFREFLLTTFIGIFDILINLFSQRDIRRRT